MYSYSFIVIQATSKLGVNFFLVSREEKNFRKGFKLFYESFYLLYNYKVISL